MDRRDIRLGQVVFFTEEGVKLYGKYLSAVPLKVIEVEPESYQGSMDICVKFLDVRRLWIHSDYVWSGECYESNEAIDTFMSDFG